jgi:hypothetical protein
MACELWALDAGAGEAILRSESRWSLVSSDRAWRPEPLEGADEVLRWSTSRTPVPVGRRFAEEDEAILVLREVCIEAWRAGSRTPTEIDRLLAEVVASRAARLEDTAQLDREWAARFPEICRAAAGLDHYYRSRGYSIEKSLSLVLEAMDLLRQRSDWRGRGASIPAILFGLAVHRDRVSPAEVGGTLPTSSGPTGDPERVVRSAEILEGLSEQVLEALALWADSDHSFEDLASILRVSVFRVTTLLGKAADSLERPLERLRHPALAKLCREVLRTRF